MFSLLAFQGSIDSSLAEKLLEEADSRAEVLRGENVRLRDLLVSHLQRTTEMLREPQQLGDAAGDRYSWAPD